MLVGLPRFSALAAQLAPLALPLADLDWLQEPLEHLQWDLKLFIATGLWNVDRFFLMIAVLVHSVRHWLTDPDGVLKFVVEELFTGGSSALIKNLVGAAFMLALLLTGLFLALRVVLGSNGPMDLRKVIFWAALTGYLLNSGPGFIHEAEVFRQSLASAGYQAAAAVGARIEANGGYNNTHGDVPLSVNGQMQPPTPLFINTTHLTPNQNEITGVDVAAAYLLAGESEVNGTASQALPGAFAQYYFSDGAGYSPWAPGADESARQAALARATDGIIRMFTGIVPALFAVLQAVIFLALGLAAAVILTSLPLVLPFAFFPFTEVITLNVLRGYVGLLVKQFVISTILATEMGFLTYWANQSNWLAFLGTAAVLGLFTWQFVHLAVQTVTQSLNVITGAIGAATGTQLPTLDPAGAAAKAVQQTGSMLQTGAQVAGAVLAPATGGASLALAGVAGGLIGAGSSALAQAIPGQTGGQVGDLALSELTRSIGQGARDYNRWQANHSPGGRSAGSAAPAAGPQAEVNSYLQNQRLAPITSQPRMNGVDGPPAAPAGDPTPRGAGTAAPAASGSVEAIAAGQPMTSRTAHAVLAPAARAARANPATPGAVREAAQSYQAAADEWPDDDFSPQPRPYQQAFARALLREAAVPPMPPPPARPSNLAAVLRPSERVIAGVARGESGGSSIAGAALDRTAATLLADAGTPPALRQAAAAYQQTTDAPVAERATGQQTFAQALLAALDAPTAATPADAAPPAPAGLAAPRRMHPDARLITAVARGAAGDSPAVAGELHGRAAELLAAPDTAPALRAAAQAYRQSSRAPGAEERLAGQRAFAQALVAADPAPVGAPAPPESAEGALSDPANAPPAGEEAPDGPAHAATATAAAPVGPPAAARPAHGLPAPARRSRRQLATGRRFAAGRAPAGDAAERAPTPLPPTAGAAGPLPAPAPDEGPEDRAPAAPLPAPPISPALPVVAGAAAPVALAGDPAGPALAPAAAPAPVASSTTEDTSRATAPTSMRAMASRLAAQGFPVFPLNPRSKVPPKGGHGFQGATTDPAAIRAAWSPHSSRNIGIATGQGLIAIDEDVHGATDGRAFVAENPDLFPATVRQQTPTSGRHHLYRLPPGVTIPNSIGRLAPGVDVRGDGGYIVGPGSTHPNGGTYQWEAGASPDERPIAAAPPALVARLQALAADPPPAPGGAPPPGAGPVAAGAAPPETPHPPTNLLLERALEMRPAGGRNASGFWLATQLRDNGYSEYEAEPVMRDYQGQVANAGDHPYTWGEAQASLRQAYKRSPRGGWARRPPVAPAPPPAPKPGPPALPSDPAPVPVTPPAADAPAPVAPEPLPALAAPITTKGDPL